MKLLADSTTSTKANRFLGIGIANGDILLLILPELSDVSSSELSSDSGEGIRTHDKYGYPRRGWEHLEDDDQGSEDGDEPESTIALYRILRIGLMSCLGVPTST